jgi:Protein of unknown function (DUF3592)
MTPQTHELLEGGSVALLVIGAVALFRAVRTAQVAARAAHWPTVPGVVRHSSVNKGRSMFNMSRSGMGKGLVVYRAQVIYAYRVNGVHFEGRRVRFGAPKRERVKDHVQDLVSRYPAEQPVQVRYDPERPADSVLELGIDPLWRQAIAFSVVTLVLGLGLGAVMLFG